MGTNKLVPKRRFEEFTSDWEKKRIENISESFSGGTPSAGNSLFYGGNIPFIRSGEVNSEKTELFITEEGLESSSAKLIDKGDILYALYGATSGEVGISKITGAINQAVLVIKPKYGNDSYFLSQWLKNQKKNIINTYLQGGQGNLSGNIVKQLEVDLPKDKKEQQKIGEFFKHLDEMIALQQKKIEKTKALKSAYLAEMFPAEGERVPKRRFAGFTDEWEVRNLGSFTKLITKGTTPKDEDTNGKVNFIKVENIKEGKIDPTVKISNYEHENYLKRSRLEENDILFSIAGTLGRTALVKENILPANTNQALAIIRGYNFETRFLLTALKGPIVTRYIRQNPTIGAQPNLSLEQVGNLQVPTPGKKEQKKIGDFFKKLDDIIANHEQKLVKLKATKQAYLNEMFV